MQAFSVQMSIEREQAPLSLEAAAPVFTWSLSQSDTQAIRQVACRLIISTASGALLWDSGKVASAVQQLTYAGVRLPRETTCLARLTVWDDLGREASTGSGFRTGLFAESFDDPVWCGAKWIGTDTRNLWAPALTVFQLSCELTLAEGSCSAGLVLGANDPRLTDPNKNIWGLAAGKDESYLCLRLNTAPLDAGGDAVLEIFRTGYAGTDDPAVPLYTLPLPQTVLNMQDRYEAHTLRMTCVFGEADLFLDGVQLNHAPDNAGPWESGKLNLNPAGQGGDFTAFPALCHIGCKLEPGQQARFRSLTVRNYRAPSNVLAELWPQGERFSGGKDGLLHTEDPSHGGIPMVRGEFEARDVTRAYLTITARGCYEAYLNGQKVGCDFLAPGLTHYNKTHMYQVYDVTDLLHTGSNALAIELGEGWWSGSITFRGANWNFWGDVQSVLCKLTVEHPDGSVSAFVSSPETFTACSEGPIRYASLFQGQVYDAGFEPAVAGWKEPGFRGNWSPAVEIPISPANAVLEEVPAMKDGSIDLRCDGQKVLGQIGNGVRCAAVLTAQSVEEVRPGVWIYDFGQNFAGVPDLRLPGSATRREVTLRYGEICYPMLPEYGQNQGMLMVENLRAAHATDVVYLGAQPIDFCPRSTFHGFRYLEVTGLDDPLPLEDVRALALSSAEVLTAGFSCSDPRIDRLFQNITWSLRSNFLSIPTDCPQRNERMGWSGDLSVFARTAVCLTDADAFLRRHLYAMRDLQDRNGMFPDIAPVSNGFGGILWGSAGITVPWEAYRQYGDEAILRGNYDAMARYIAYLEAHVDPVTGLQTAGELGDWLGPQVSRTENALLWMAYFLYDLDIMAKVSAVLGRAEAAAYRASYEKHRSTFNRVFFDPETHRTVYSCQEAARGNRMPFQPVDLSKPLPPQEPGGGYRMDTMTSYCVPLALGIVEEAHRAAAQAHLAACCQREELDDDGVARPAYSLMTGFIGTALLLPALSEAGRDDIAYRILENDQYPSWLYPVAQGATTIWERLDSYTLERGFGGHNSMNSFNHYAFGAVGQWLLSRCLGIERDAPGFSSFRLRPRPDPTGAMTWAGGWCDTPLGRIESRWEQNGTQTRYAVTVPSGSACILELPADPQAVVTESGRQPAQADGVAPLDWADGVRRFRLEPGSYRFCVTKAVCV